MMLDLFAGTGNVSLEALSRGALRTVMLDREPACIKNIHRNLEHLGFAERAKVIRGDVLKPLDFLLAYSDNEGYDIIFRYGENSAPAGSSGNNTHNNPL